MRLPKPPVGTTRLHWVQQYCKSHIRPASVIAEVSHTSLIRTLHQWRPIFADKILSLGRADKLVKERVIDS